MTEKESTKRRKGRDRTGKRIAKYARLPTSGLENMAIPRTPAPTLGARGARVKRGDKKKI